MSFRFAGIAALCFALTPAGVVAQDKYVDADGVRLHYIDQGTGEPVVLVHGFNNSAQIWSTSGIFQSLAQNYRVIAFDLRGHGKGDKPHDPSRYGEEMFARHRSCARPARSLCRRSGLLEADACGRA